MQPRAVVKKRYEAYDKQGRSSLYTDILCVTQPSQSPQSRYLLSVIFSADIDEAFTLIYSFLAVEIKGRNLKAARRAIASERCEFIPEYHEKEFLEPGKDEPMITSIRFITGSSLDDMLSSYREGK